MGVGNFQFSREESEREKQMEFFKQIEKEVMSFKKETRVKNVKNISLLK